MSITNHGTFTRYVPSPWPEGVPSGVMFSKRTVGDGTDWYVFLETLQGNGKIKVILTRGSAQDPWVVLTADTDASRLFPTEGALLLETDGAMPEPGYVYSAGALIPKPVDLVAYAKSVRYAKETSSLIIGGMPISMDDRSKTLIMGSYITAVRNPNWTTIWQGETGEFTVTASSIAIIFDAMTARINACFTTYASVASAIAGGTITTTEAIDAAFAAVT